MKVLRSVLVVASSLLMIWLMVPRSPLLLRLWHMISPPYVIADIREGQVLSGDVPMIVYATDGAFGYLTLWIDGKRHSDQDPSKDKQGHWFYAWDIPTEQFANGRHTLAAGVGKTVLASRTVIFRNPKPPAPGKRGKGKGLKDRAEDEPPPSAKRLPR